MEVENVYQDNQGKWHIDYSPSNLMGLAIRVYVGQFVLGLICFIPLMILSVFAGFVLGKSLPEQENTSSSFNVQQESICNELYSKVDKRNSESNK